MLRIPLILWAPIGRFLLVFVAPHLYRPAMSKKETEPPPYENLAVVGKKRVNISDITVATVELEPGESVSFLTNYHGIGLSPDRRTFTPAAWDTDGLIDIEWQPSTIGYQSPDITMHAVMLEKLESTFLFLPDRLFKSAAFETIDTSKITPRWAPNIGDPIAVGLVGTLQRVHESTDAADFPMIGEAIATALAVRMMQQLGATIRPADIPHPGGLPADVLQRVVDYVEANISEPMTLTELAGVALLSPFHFARSFQKATGSAPVRYVWGRRIERAKLGLRNKRTALAIVAYDAGFSSQAHFSTAFKKAMGVTPAAFRSAIAMLVAARGARYLLPYLQGIPGLA